MAQETGTASVAAQIARLITDARRLVFTQAVLILERLLDDTVSIGGSGPPSRERIRLRPSVSLACPTSDLEQIAHKDDGTIQVTTTFGGLYGADSPLPYHYSDPLIRNSHESSGQRVRSFLDIFHHRLLSLLYRAWRNNRPAIRTRGEHGLDLAKGVDTMLGRQPAHGSPSLSDARIRILRTPTAEGLSALLRARLGYPATVAQLQLRRATIPLDQRTTLGRRNARLGREWVLGDRVIDRNRIGIHIFSESYASYVRLLPGGDDRHLVEETIEGYLRQPMDTYLEVALSADHVFCGQPGRKGRLGRDFWLGLPAAGGIARWTCSGKQERAAHGS